MLNGRRHFTHSTFKIDYNQIECHSSLHLSPFFNCVRFVRSPFSIEIFHFFFSVPWVVSSIFLFQFMDYDNIMSKNASDCSPTNDCDCFAAKRKLNDLSSSESIIHCRNARLIIVCQPKAATMQSYATRPLNDWMSFFEWILIQLIRLQHLMAQD